MLSSDIFLGHRLFYSTVPCIKSLQMLVSSDWLLGGGHVIDGMHTHIHLSCALYVISIILSILSVSTFRI